MADEILEQPSVAAAEQTTSPSVEAQVAAQPVVESTTTEQPSTQPLTQHQQNLLDLARNRLGGQWQDEQQFLDDITELRHRYEMDRQYAEYGRRILPYQSEIDRMFQERNKPVEQPKQEIPAWRHNLENAQVAKAIREYSQFDPQTQRFVPVENAPAWAREHLDKYQDWFENHKQNLFSDRVDEYFEKMGFVRSTQLDKIKEEIEQRVMQQFADREAEAKARKEFNQIATRAYQHKDGQMLQDRSGRPVYTDWGRVFHAEVNRLEAAGITDPAQVRYYAEAAATKYEHDKKLAEQKIEAEQRRSAQLPPQVGSPVSRITPAARPETVPSPNMSLGQMLKASGFGDDDWQSMRQDIATDWH